MTIIMGYVGRKSEIVKDIIESGTFPATGNIAVRAIGRKSPQCYRAPLRQLVQAGTIRKIARGKYVASAEFKKFLGGAK